MDAGGGRQWWLPNISSLSRGRGKLGADPVRRLFEHVAGPVAAAGAPGVRGSHPGHRTSTEGGLRRDSPLAAASALPPLADRPTVTPARTPSPIANTPRL